MRTLPAVLSVGMLLCAETVVDVDLRNGADGAWYFSGAAQSVEGTGAVLVDREEQAVGTLAYDQRISSEGLKVEFHFTLEPGNHGLGDGLAVGLVATPTPDVLGTGGGLLGLGNVPSCTASIIVEFDALANDLADFGPMGAALIHTGVAYAAGDSVTGQAYLPTLKASDVSHHRDADGRVDLIAAVHLHGNMVTVCCGPDGTEPVPVLVHELPDFVPFHGYLVFGAANGAIAGRATVHSVRAETGTLPPPLLSARTTAEGIELTWETKADFFDSFALARDGEPPQPFSAERRTYTHISPARGRHVYELVGIAPDGTPTAPAVITMFYGRPVLVVDAATSGDTPSPHAKAWLDRLNAADRPTVRVTTVDGVALSEFAAVIWIGGSGRAERPLSDLEENVLARYVTETDGARLFMEGASLWSFVGRGPLAAVDGVEAVSAGWPATEIRDHNGRIMAYYGRTCAVDELKPAPAELDAEFTVLWRRRERRDTTADQEAVAGLLARTDLDRTVIIASAVELYRIVGAEARQEAFDAYLPILELPYQEVMFRRGDAVPDGSVNIGDAIAVLGYLFAGSGAPPCLDAADTNDDGEIQISDPIALLIYLFRDGPLPLPGSAVCGPDPTPDELPPCVYQACE